MKSSKLAPQITLHEYAHAHDVQSPLQSALIASVAKLVVLDMPFFPSIDVDND
jgi:hypothetical protein